MTLTKASEFPDKVKNAWRKAIDMETRTGTGDVTRLTINGYADPVYC